MLRQVNNSTVFLIGDPHLSRKFINGVPLERRGEREQAQEQYFLSLLYSPADNPAIKTVIIMGDLFDQFRVDNDCLLRCYEMISKASWHFPTVQYVVLQGNHDVSRNMDSVSSFEVLDHMCSNLENVTFVTEPTYLFTAEGDGLMFIPYDAFMPADQVAEIASRLTPSPYAAVFGHWDVESFGGHDHNLIPAKQLATRCTTVFTGHVHGARVFERDGVTVEITGSMMPYAHGEDLDNKIYLTLSLDEVEKRLASDPASFHNNVLRILLKPGETPPANIDAMQLSFKYVGEADEQGESQVQMEGFSFKDIFEGSMAENGVSEDMCKLVWEQYQEKNRDA